MKCLKEPLSRLANKQDEAKGAFFEVRFKSVAILDDESLLATCAYIDLNPVAAGVTKVPEASPYTSYTTHVENVKAQGRTRDLKAAVKGSVAGSSAAAGLEEPIWLCTIEDRSKLDSARKGMLDGFSLGSYLLLVDFTGRLFHDGKAVISAEQAGILERLGSSAESWRPASKSSAKAASSADSSPPAESACASRRTPWRAPPAQPWWMPGPINRPVAASSRK